MLEVLIIILCLLLMTVSIAITFMLATYLVVEMTDEIIKEMFWRNNRK